VKASSFPLDNQEDRWIGQLKHSFQDTYHLYFVMDFHPGGDLKTLLKNIGSFSTEDARFYFCEMIISVALLHKLGYIHRDLKPDNFLIDKKGHLKLIDFGLSKSGAKQPQMSQTKFVRLLTKIRKRTYSANSAENTRKRVLAGSLVGSPEYMAPEVLNREDYDESVDWWSLGCIFFECLVGETPFYADTVQGIFSKVMDFKKILAHNEDLMNLEELSKKLILNLLTDRPHRLSSFQSLRLHPYFDKVNWDSIHLQEPLFVPKLENEFDTSYFENIRSFKSQEEIYQLVEEDYHDPNLPTLDFLDFTFHSGSCK
jgi:serine/threonine protein kinase